MKKVILSLAVVFAVGMVSCGGNDKKAEDTAVVTEEVTEETVEETTPTVDSPVADSPVADEEPKAE